MEVYGGESKQRCGDLSEFFWLHWYQHKIDRILLSIQVLLCGVFKTDLGATTFCGARIILLLLIPLSKDGLKVVWANDGAT